MNGTHHTHGTLGRRIVGIRAGTASLIGLIALLAACGVRSPSPDVSTTTQQTATAQTRQVQATQTAQAAAPVQLTATITPSGTVAAHDVRLAITAQVTNTTTAPIYVVGLACHHPFIHVELRPQGAPTDSPALWQNWGWEQCFGGAGCPSAKAPSTAGPGIIPGSKVAPQMTFTWSATGDLSQASGLTQPGPYSVMVSTGWLSLSSDWGPAGCPQPLSTYQGIMTTQTIVLS